MEKNNDYTQCSASGYSNGDVPDFLEADFITVQYWEEYAQELGISKETALLLINRHRQIKGLSPVKVITEYIDSGAENNVQKFSMASEKERIPQSGKIRKPIRKESVLPDIYINDRKKAKYKNFPFKIKP